MAKLKVLLRSDKPLSDQSCPIWIRITQERKSKYISLGHSCLPEEWNERESRLWEIKPRITSEMKKVLNPQELKAIQAEYSGIKINPLAKVLNADISRAVRKLEGIKEKLEVNEKATSAKKIKGLFQTRNEAESGKSFLKYYQKQIGLFMAKEKIGTARGFQARLNILKDFLKSQDLPFEEIDKDFLDSYEGYLRKSGIKNSTINSHLKSFKNIYFRALKESLISKEKNPFLIYSLPQPNKAKKERLNIEELLSIKKLDLPKDSDLFHSRNAFLFSFYCAGIRIRDLLQLKWKYIKKEGKEERLEYDMGKSSKEKNMKLQAQALEILSFYRKKQKDPEAYIFPFLKSELKDYKAQYNQASSKTAIVNSYLKQIAEMAGIKKNLSSHIARHSFANIARKKIGLYDLKNLLGHSNLNMTKAYIDSLDYESQDLAHSEALEGT